MNDELPPAPGLDDAAVRTYLLICLGALFVILLAEQGTEGGAGHPRAVGGQRRGPVGGPVPHGDVQTGPQQAMGHAGAHEAGSQHRDAHQ